MRAVRSPILPALAAGLLLPLLPASGVLAEELAIDQIEPAIKYRQNVMDAMAGLTGASVGQIRDGLGFGPDLLAMAKGLQAVTRDVAVLFPPGTDFGETEAKPEVWSKPDEFKAASDKLSEAVDAYVAAVEQGERAGIAKAFKGVGDACKGCHEDFRKKDE